MVDHTAVTQRGQLAWLDCLLRLQGAHHMDTAQAATLLDECAQIICHWTGSESLWLGRKPPPSPAIPVVRGHGHELGALSDSLRPVLEQCQVHAGYVPEKEPGWRWTAWTAQSPRLPVPLVRWMTDLGYHTLNVLARQDACGCQPRLILASHDSHHSLGGIQRLALQALASEALALLDAHSGPSPASVTDMPARANQGEPILATLERLHHDVRTPLNAIAAATYLALQTELPETSRRYVEQAARSVNRVADIIAEAVRHVAPDDTSRRAPDAPVEADEGAPARVAAPDEAMPDFSHSELEATLESNIAALAQLLQEHDTNARLLVDTVTHKLRQAGCDQSAGRIRRLVQQYEYDHALQLLQQAAAMTRLRQHNAGVAQ